MRQSARGGPQWVRILLLTPLALISFLGGCNKTDDSATAPAPVAGGKAEPAKSTPDAGASSDMPPVPKKKKGKVQ